MKRILAMIISVALVATLAVSGSIAYLTDTDSAVNVATVGNINIEQLENDMEEGGFDMGKPLFPAYYDNLEEGEDGFWKEDFVGALNKKVTVKNTGKSDAYIRTWLAFEADETETGIEHILINWADEMNNAEKVKFEELGVAEIGGDQYAVFAVTYLDPYAKDEITPASLMQVAMNKAADNDYVEHFGDTYEILVFSQAVQTENLSQLGAYKALNEAFNNGKEALTAEDHPWTDESSFTAPVVVTNAESLVSAFEAGGDIYIGNDINVGNIDEALEIPAGVIATLYLNGNTLSASYNKETGSAAFIKNNGTLNIVEEGTITFAYTGTVNNEEKVGYYTIDNYGTLNIAEATIQNTTEGVWDEAGSMARTAFAIDHKNGTLTVESGIIESTGRSLRIAGYAGSPTATLNGGSFVGQVWVQGLNNKTTALTINGGSFKPVGADGSSIFVGNDKGTNVVNITDGTLETKLGAKSTANIYVTGGTFGENPKNPSGLDFLAATGCYSAQDDDGAWVVKMNTASSVSKLKYLLEKGSSARLGADITDVDADTQSITIPADAHVVLDLNGHDITAVANEAKASAVINNRGTLTLTGEGKISYKSEMPSASYGYATNTITNTGVLIVEKGVTIENATTESGASYAIDNNSNGVNATLIVNGGTINGNLKNVAIRQFSNSKNHLNSVTINDGTVSGRRAVWIQLPSSNVNETRPTELTVNGGTLRCTGTDMSQPVIYSYTYGNSFADTKITINGGTFLGSYCAFGAGGDYSTKETVEINGGTFEYDVYRYISSTEKMVIKEANM